MPLAWERIPLEGTGKTAYRHANSLQKRCVIHYFGLCRPVLHGSKWAVTMAESLLQCQGHPFGEESFGQNTKPSAKNSKRTSFTAHLLPCSTGRHRFANPYASWERGLNEYTNSKGILPGSPVDLWGKLIRQYIPMPIRRILRRSPLGLWKGIPSGWGRN